MNTKRAFLIFSIFLLSITSAQADHDYSVDPLGEPHSYDYVSPESPSFRAVNLTYNNQPVSPENLAADYGEIIYEYPVSGTFNDTMTYFKDGIWVANIQTNDTTKKINYTVRNETEASLHIYAESQETLDTSELKIEKPTTFNDPIKAGKSVTIRLDITNTTSGNQVDDANLNLRFANGTYSTSNINIGYNDNDNIYRTSFDIPDFTNQTFAGQLTANKGSEQSSYSFQINTKPAVEGELDRLNSVDGACKSDEFPDQCEGNATLDVGYNLTQVAADGVNMTVWKHDRNGNPVEHEKISLERNGSKPSNEPGYYETDFDFPFINRSQYGNEVKLMFNASTDNRQDIDNYTIDYKAFRANIDFEKSYAYQSGDISIPLTLERYFSLSTLEEEELHKLDANITDPNGQLLASYNLSNVSLGTDEQFTETIDIPGDAMTGDYQIEMFVEDVYRGNKTVLRSFSVRENTQTFELSDTTLEPEFNRKGQYETELNITDISGTGLNISMAKTNGLEENLNFTEDFQVDPDQMKTLTLEWNISDLQSYSGEIEVIDEDSNYNTTIDVDTDAPDCEMQDGNLCSPSSSGVTETMDERTTRETTVEVINIGEQGSTRTVSMSVSGNISDYVSVPEEESFSDTYEIPVNFTPQERGMFTGTMTAASENSEIQYDLELNSNVPSGTPNVDVTETVNIGPLVEGESEDAEVTIDNTGEIEVGNISLSSGTYSIDADTDGMKIPGESSDTISVTFNDVSSSSGQLEISLEALEQANETVDVSAEVYSDYSSRIDNLFNDIQDLRDSTGNQQALSTLDEAETTLDSAEVSWENGNYEQASNTYEDADEKYQQAQSTVESSDPGDDPGSSNPGANDPGNQQPDPGTGNENESGGLPIIPILVVLVLLTVGGFVFYESYIPEEGDPLYDVLGQ